MAGSTLYDRVMAAYGSDEDEPGGCPVSSCADPDADSPWRAAAAHAPRRPSEVPSPQRPTAHRAGLKINSIRVPFDPEDQSDDEVVVSSVYQRETQAGKASSSGHGRPRNGSAPSTPDKRTQLSPTATPFRPKNADSDAVVQPLVEVPGSRAVEDREAVRGKPYPGRRVPFCPWLVVQNYHAWFVGKQNSERIGPYFAQQALLQCQPWDFCYVWHPAKEKEGTFVLVVPTAQFQVLLDRINQTLKIQLVVPPGKNGEKFAVFFGQQKTPLPRFLGRAPDAPSFDALVGAVPPMDPADAIAEMPTTTPKALEMYVKKINGLSYTYGKGANKINKSEKAYKKRILQRQTTGRQIKRVQRYLGIRQKVHRGAMQRPVQGGPPVLDELKPPPHGMERDALFVAMDIESYEFNHGAITEIGFGILDTRDLVGAPPGPGCENWLGLVRGRHLRIREHATMVNRRHVQGCENNFNFGTTEFVGIRDILRVVTSILQPRSIDGAVRDVVLVGHDIRSDISLIKNIGFHVEDGMFLEIVDTQDVHQHLRMKTQQAGLRSVLNDLEIEHSFLHNGGNDAVYTLQALVRLVVKIRQDSLRREAMRIRPGYTPDMDIIQEGWDTGGELTDGTPRELGNWRFSDETEAPGKLRSGRAKTATPTKTAGTAYKRPSPGSNGTPGAGTSAAAGDDSDDLIDL